MMHQDNQLSELVEQGKDRSIHVGHSNIKIHLDESQPNLKWVILSLEGLRVKWSFQG